MTILRGNRNARAGAWLTAGMLLAASGVAEDLNLIPYPRKVELGTGQTAVGAASRIVCTDPAAQGVAVLLAEELKYLHGLSLPVIGATAAKTGDIVIGKDKSLAGEAYRLVADGTVTISAAALGGYHAGSATLVQALRASDGGASLPSMTLNDEPFREFRALMVDVKVFSYAPETIYQLIRLCRFYKVRYFCLHTGEPQWIGAVMDSASDMGGTFSPQQMADYIAYGRRLGVYLFPHNESTPHFPTLKTALTAPLTAAGFANYVDEFDGKGPYAYDGRPDDRFWAFMREVTRRAVDQFAAGYPDGKLPFYHIGPVQGEGGMGPDLAARFLEILKEKDSGIRMILWDGPNAKDSRLFPHRDRLIVAYYSGSFSSSKIHDYLREGWQVINAPFDPLYILGSGGKPVDEIFRDWNVLSAGMGDNKIQFDAEPVWAKQVMGGTLCTWEISEENQLKFLSPRLPIFAEHSWNHKPLPYPAGNWPAFQARAKALVPLAERVLAGPEDHTPPCPEAPEWKHPPKAIGNIVIMQARPMADPSGVEYQFECTEGKSPSSGWQPNSFYVAEDLQASTRYAWRVRLRDGSGAHNETPWSKASPVTTAKAFPTALKAHFQFREEIAHGKPAADSTGNIEGAGYGNQVRPRPYPASVYFGGRGVQVEGGWTCIGLGNIAKVLNPMLDNFSISMWMAPNADKGIHQLFVSGIKDGKRSFSLLNDYEELILDVGDAGGNYKYKVPVAGKFAPLQWSHIVVTFTRRTPDRCEVNFYIDGQQVGKTLEGPAAPGAGPGWSLNETSVAGALADVRVYQGTLAAEQVRFLAKPFDIYRGAARARALK